MSDNFDTEDVYDLMSSVSDRDVDGISTPIGDAFWIHFKADDPTEDNRGLRSENRWRFEVNFQSGNLWLHKETDDGTETVWENKSRY